MQQLKRVRMVWVIVALLAMLITRTVEATAPQTLQCGSWNIVKNPNPYQYINMLNAVTAVSASDVWAVGWGAMSNNSPWQTLIEHWDGTTWRVVPSPNPNAFGNILNAVTAVSASDVWAVGNVDGYGQTLTEHWDGQHWTVIPSPNVGILRNVLTSVTGSSPTDVWAVGFSRINGSTPNQTLIEHWDGTRWSVIASPRLVHYDNYLNGITAITSTNVWAVGLYGHTMRNSVSMTLVEHWDGIKWRVVPSPNRGDAGSWLTSVTTVSAQDVWAVGEGGLDKTLTEQWNGTKWSIIKSPQGTQNNTNILVGVTAIAANNLWAVGSDLTNAPDYFVTLTEHWDGTHWKVIASPNVALYNNYLTGVVAASAQQVWAVGYSQNQYSVSSTLIEHYC